MRNDNEVLKINQIKNELKAFVQDRATRKHKTFLEVISELNLEYALLDELPLDVKKISTMARIEQQKRSNIVYLDELKKINELCTKIKVLVFKGLAHSLSLYDIPQYRCFDDIDLFVRREDYIAVVNILMQLGYTEYDAEIRKNEYLFYEGTLFSRYAKNNNNSIENFIKNHLIFKKVVKGIEVKIELHLYLFPPLRYPEIDNESIFLNSRKINVSRDFELNTLSIDDTVICSACHLSKHIAYGVMRPDENRNSISMKSLIDIKLLIDKFDVSWEYIVSIADKWNVSGSLLLIFKLINYIFPRTICENIIEGIYQNVKTTNEKSSHESLIRGISLLDPVDIFDFNLMSFFERETISQNNNTYYALDKTVLLRKINLSDEIVVVPYWDNDYFYMSVIDNETKEQIRKIIISVTIGSHVSYLFAQTFHITIENENMRVTSSYIAKNKIESATESKNYIDCTLKDNNVDIKILWKNINIIPTKKMVLPFNVRIIKFDKSDKIENIYSLINDNFYNDYGTCSVCLW